jgi:hypothetical protein
MGKVKRLELGWQLYSTSLPVRDLENFRPRDFCSTECTLESWRISKNLRICRHFLFQLVFNFPCNLTRSRLGAFDTTYITQLLKSNINNTQPQGHPPQRDKFWVSLRFKCTGYSRQLKRIRLPSALWVSSDFRLKVDICALLRYYAVYSDNSLPTFRDNLPAPSSRVKNLFFWIRTGKDGQ